MLSKSLLIIIGRYAPVPLCQHNFSPKYGFGLESLVLIALFFHLVAGKVLRTDVNDIISCRLHVEKLPNAKISPLNLA